MDFLKRKSFLEQSDKLLDDMVNLGCLQRTGFNFGIILLFLCISWYREKLKTNPAFWCRCWLSTSSLKISIYSQWSLLASQLSNPLHACAEKLLTLFLCSSALRSPSEPEPLHRAGFRVSLELASRASSRREGHSFVSHQLPCKPCGFICSWWRPLF